MAAEFYGEFVVARRWWFPIVVEVWLNHWPTENRAWRVAIFFRRSSARRLAKEMAVQRGRRSDG